MKFIAIVTCVVAALSAAAAQTMDLEWNARYDTSVPYEVELSPAKLETLADVPKGSGFVVKADGRDLGAVAFTGKAPDTIDLRFRVPPGAKRLTCEAGEVALAHNGNTVNNIKGHPRMTVVPADGLLFSNYNIGKTINGKQIKHADFHEELAGDPFPGTKGTTELNDTMGVVNFKFYNGDSNTNKALANISESNNGVITFDFISNFTDYLDGLFPLGDVNHDGDVSVVDVMMVVNHILGVTTDGIHIKNANVNCDNALDISDVMSIVDIVLHRGLNVVTTE